VTTDHAAAPGSTREVSGGTPTVGGKARSRVTAERPASQALVTRAGSEKPPRASPLFSAPHPLRPVQNPQLLSPLPETLLSPLPWPRVSPPRPRRAVPFPRALPRAVYRGGTGTADGVPSAAARERGLPPRGGGGAPSRAPRLHGPAPRRPRVGVGVGGHQLRPRRRPPGDQGQSRAPRIAFAARPAWFEKEKFQDTATSLARPRRHAAPRRAAPRAVSVVVGGEGAPVTFFGLCSHFSGGACGRGRPGGGGGGAEGRQPGHGGVNHPRRRRRHAALPAHADQGEARGNLITLALGPPYSQVTVHRPFSQHFRELLLNSSSRGFPLRSMTLIELCDSCRRYSSVAVSLLFRCLSGDATG
jgi:translation initiation factor IF-2